MGIEVKPFGVKCNIQCQYCYQNPERDAGNIANSYDLSKMIATLDGETRSFSLFGGEALMMPEQDLEALFSYGFQRFGKNGIQTNGTLINDNHLRMFREYKVSVGISLDGPGELNDVRWAGTLERTREATAKVEAAIERLCKEGMPPSIIVTLHRGNATPEKLPKLIDWIRRLRDQGVKSLRLHILEVDDQSVRKKYSLSEAENLEAFLAFLRAEEELKPLRMDIFNDMRNMLRGKDNRSTCVWTGCDPYTTAAVQGLGGDGQRSNCSRTNKDGIDYVKSDGQSFERYVMLYHTPQAHNGCQGCRFFLMCKGQCPGTAVGGDWRNRTEHCSVWMGLYEHLERTMLDAGETPISLSPDRKRLEDWFISGWLMGQNPKMFELLEGMNRGNGSSDQQKESRRETPARESRVSA